MDDRTRIKILEHWRDNPSSIGKLPEELQEKGLKREVKSLLLEVGDSPFDPLTPSGVSRYLNELKDRVSREETLEIQRRALDIQEKVKKTQWIIAGAMVLTVLVSLYTADITQRSYRTQLELDSPLFEVNLHCSPISDKNGVISIEPKVTNHGKVGAFVSGEMLTEGDIILRGHEVDGVPQNFTGKNRVFTNKFVEGADQISWNISIDAEKSTKDFRVIFRFSCTSIDERYPCKFVTNNFSCDYRFNGTRYIAQQCCIL